MIYMTCPYCNSDRIEKYLTVTHDWYGSDTKIYDGNEYDHSTEEWVQCKDCKRIYIDVHCYGLVKRTSIKAEDAEPDSWGLLGKEEYVEMPKYFLNREVD